LPETFPNVQFFLTTHSPVVASAVKPESLWVLRNGEIKHAEAYGQDVGLVLSEVFDTPPRLDAVRHDLDELFEAIHRQDRVGAQEKLETLESVIGPSDPELVQARVMMQGYALA
jgi:predicted ATP-binding protein involved in virulence